MTQTYRKWIVAAPLSDGRLSADHFALRTEPMPEPADGEALVRVELINIHSATRARIANGMTRLSDTDYTNYAYATVIRSRDPAFKEGDAIACQAGWQEMQIISSNNPSVGYGPISDGAKALNRTNSQWTYAFRQEMLKRWPADVLMEMFGTSGMTAYFGMRQCGPLKPDDTVLVAGATGSVGSIVAQLARVAGSRVVGLAGGPDRCRWAIETLGIADCIDYKAHDFEQRLAAACPDGIDVFSDGIGGRLTEIVTGMMNRNGRLFAYGGAGGYYADDVPATNQMTSPQQQRMTLRQAFGISDSVERTLQEKSIRSEAWIVDAFYHERLVAEDELSRLLLRGAIKPINTVVDGFEKLPAAIVGLYEKPREGKLQVRFYD
jgi:NADPH-dependent curcumin reductase CurA